MAENKQTEIAYLPPAAPPTNHGHTIAAWFAMIGIMVGTAVASVGIAMASTAVIGVGAAVVLLSLIGGLVLRNMGYGQKQGSR